MKTSEIGANISKIRGDNNLNQKQFGEKIGYSQRTISDWEKGNTEPNICAIRKICKIFDISYEELIDG